MVSVASSANAATAAADLLRAARADDRAGKVSEAIREYDAVIQAGLESGELAVMAEAYRRVAVLHHRRNQPMLARSFCEARHALATQEATPAPIFILLPHYCIICPTVLKAMSQHLPLSNVKQYQWHLPWHGVSDGGKHQGGLHVHSPLFLRARSVWPR